ncbi:fungal-specific transcription factor domain-containing protein [Neohortaea acidophila]|uniref:Fungal-specific transcription factor domain-containing protein n=1 Tax=Neohortaea acidophila TaxID=245834 RepID=A0A6A6PGT5_9PEZI|nr:fungal-specific transcription factor domain-containing protein [Neohortaea acidophila]KAF2478833.1 fungal-specific transcription factor domain-containing protein [Neohortaea acidophila]
MAYEEAHLPGPPTAAAEDDAAIAAQKLSRRACDCCRKRKVKCDGGNPCTPCQKAMLPCAYLQPPKKKGPKGLRSQRVLHMLRRIDDHMAAGLPSPPTPQQTSAFGNWGWHTQSSGSNGGAMPPPNAHAHSEDSYGPHTSVAPDQPYYPPSQSSMPPPPQQSPFPPHSMRFSPEAQFASWTNKSPSVPPPTSDPSSTMSPSTSSSLHLRLPAECFLPYIKLFFDHMFPIMPVIDRNIYVNPNLYTDSSLLTPDEYCFLCSICAATMVQLDDSISQPPAIHPPKRNDDLFAEECLRERKVYDFIESPSRLSVMTSFFLFAYYGNNEKHDKAWHYLQESITFAQTLNMDDENAYRDLDPTEAQWRRRLYWLLFITERAYAVQRRKHTRLYANVKQPSIFDNEEAQLLNGFVNLANLFAAVDDDFVKAWRGSRKQSLCDEQWLAKTQSQLDNAVLALGSVSETQQMDIRVTREWLHMLAWQMGVSNGLMWGEGESDGTRLYYPVEIAKRVVEITSGANALALDSHGIGMASCEQKLYDIAGCLADVLRCTAGDPSATYAAGKEYLHILSQKLSSIRGKESRYLKPLLARMEGLMGYELNAQPLPPPTAAGFDPKFPPANAYFNTPRMSVVESMNMLRSLSMTGGGSFSLPSSLSSMLPSLAMMEDWTQRRPSGKVYDEAETDAMDPWALNEVVIQQRQRQAI